MLAYLWMPCVLYLVASGLGLLVERVTRWTMPNGLLAPVGLAAAITVSLAVFRLKLDATIAAPALAVLALVGMWLARGDLRARLNPGWAGVAALAVYLLYVGPSMVTGHWTWAGYNFVNDPSVNFVYAELLADHGIAPPGTPPSTITSMQTNVLATHYPLGAHALLAVFASLSLVEIAAAYQPLISAMAGLAAMAIAVLVRRGGMPGAAAAATGALALSANLVYQYGQHGGFKEILMVLLVAAAAAIVAEAVAVGISAGAAAVATLCLVSTLAVFSAAGAPYLLAYAGVAAGAVLLAGVRIAPRRLAVLIGAAVAAALIAAVPYVQDVVVFGQGAGQGFTSKASTGKTTEFGHLLRQLPWSHGTGISFAEDYRLPIEPGRPVATAAEAVLVILVVLLALFGLAVELRRRRPAAAILLGATGIVAIGLSPRLGAYADAKLLLIAAPGMLAAAGVGLWALAGARARNVLAGSLAALLAGGLLFADAQAARETRFAPVERLEALTDAAEHARPASGLWLHNEWEEFGKYFARGVPVDAPGENESPVPLVLRAAQPSFGFYFDLDEMGLDFLLQFSGIIRRRNPVSSRPPASFTRTYANEYYEVWRKTGGVQVLEHLSLQRPNDPSPQPDCAGLRAFARRAGPGERLIAASRPDVPIMPVDSIRNRPLGWPPYTVHPGGYVALKTPGLVHGRIDSPGGEQRVWLRGTTGRPLHVRIDGREIGAPHTVNSPGQWMEVGTVRLTRGRHEVELERPGGRPLPGDGYNGEIGPLALEPVGARESLQELPPSRVGELCGGRYDWIERVRPGS